MEALGSTAPVPRAPPHHRRSHFSAKGANFLAFGERVNIFKFKVAFFLTNFGSLSPLLTYFKIELYGLAHALSI